MNNTTSPQLQAEEKAKAIISSCKTVNHFNVAKNYIELFEKKFQDSEASIRLRNFWQKPLN